MKTLIDFFKREGDSKYHIGDFDRKLILKALEKQIPMKPGKESEDGWILLFCQRCKKNIEFGFDRPDYCPECGQAIDWGEEDD